MDDILDIVASIVKGCTHGGYPVTEILAAFVAKTVVEGDAASFSLDRKITQERKEEVIIRSIERLLERDNPSLEMIEMQVDFDSTYLHEDNEAQKKLKIRNKMISSHKSIIQEVQMEDGQDYEALTTLYRKIFKFLLEFAPNSKPSDKGVEREVAAALESVFPRVGLKAFITLPEAEKLTQVMELARIVLGIRLFNREEGRGGAGIDHMDRDAMKLATVLLNDVEKEIDYFNDACEKYQRAIVRAFIYRRKKKFLEKEKEKKYQEMLEEGGPEAISALTGGGPGGPGGIGGPGGGTRHHHGVKTDEMFLISQLEDVNDYVIERWNQELSNRRQYLLFLKSLQEELKYLKNKVSTHLEKLKTELLVVKSLVNNKSSIPKEVVYPKFDSIGQAWLALYDEVVTLIARSNTFQALNRYRLSFSPTLADELHGDEDPEEVTLHGDNTGTGNGLGADGKDRGDGSKQEKGSSKDEDAKAAQEKAAAEAAAAAAMNASNSSALDSLYLTGCVILTPQNTPDFTLLPLELQGFCPWTIVEARGLLLPGKPHLGIVRYENRYYIFDHELAMKAFMKAPEKYLQGIKEKALKNPEYIHLLRLMKWFPTASIAKLLEKHDAEINNLTGQPLTKDAGTETPVHFQDSYIDLNYHWNEWELRRRALKIVNLQHCKTTGQQTDKSHFHREVDTQVYLPRDASSQTKRDKGTNPPIVTTYIEGLRGKTVIAEEKNSGQMKKKVPLGQRKMLIMQQLKGQEGEGQEEEEQEYYGEEDAVSGSGGESERDAKGGFVMRKIGYPKVNVVRLTLDL